MSSSRIIYNRKRRSDDESSSSDNSDEDIPPLKRIRDWNTWDTDGSTFPKYLLYLTFGKIRKVIDWVFQRPVRHSERDGMSRHRCLNRVPIPIEDDDENMDVVEVSSDNDDPIIEEDDCDFEDSSRDNLQNPSAFFPTRGVTLSSLSRQPVNGCNSKAYRTRNVNDSSDHQKMKSVKYAGPLTNPSPDVEIVYDTREVPNEDSDDLEIVSEIYSKIPSSGNLARPSISSVVSKFAQASRECDGASSSSVANGNAASFERERSSNKSFTAHEVIRLQEKAHYQLILDKMIGTSATYHPIVPKINPQSSETQIDLTGDKSRLGKKENLVEPVNEFLQKYYKPYLSTYKPCASPKADLPEFTADDDDVQIIEPDSSDSDLYTPRPRMKPADFFSPNWIEELKKTITLETEQHLQTVAIQEEKLERYRKIRGEKFFKENQILLGQAITKEPPGKDEFPELTPDMDERIEWALGVGSQTEILSSFKDCTCTSIDLATLTGLNWLNDSIINFYLALIRERSRNHPEYPQVYCCNTYFYAALKGRGPTAVLRWTRRIEDKKNIFQFDMVFVPLHLGMHWALCVIDNRTKKIKYYDSMQGTDDQSLRMVQNFLVVEKKDKLKITMDPNEYSFEMVKDIPQQMNGSDCGMFTLKYAEYLSRDVPITFSQEHMQYFRRRMIFEILDKKLF